MVCGEAISPPFLLADPYGAGSAAVVTNVVRRARDGRPAAGIVDMLVAPDKEHASRVLEGIAWAADKLGVPIVGGHLTLGHQPALSASAPASPRPRCGPRTPSPATSCSRRSRPTAGT